MRLLAICLAGLATTACSLFDGVRATTEWVPRRSFGSRSAFEPGDGQRFAVAVTSTQLDPDVEFDFEAAWLQTEHRVRDGGPTMRAYTLENLFGASYRVGGDVVALVSRAAFGPALSGFTGDVVPPSAALNLYGVVRGSLGIEIGGTLIGEAAVSWFATDPYHSPVGHGFLFTLGGGVQF